MYFSSTGFHAKVKKLSLPLYLALIMTTMNVENAWKREFSMIYFVIISIYLVFVETWTLVVLTLSARAVEYTDCFSAER